MKKFGLFVIFIFSAGISVADDASEVAVLESLECTDEEVMEYIDQRKNPHANIQAEPTFEDYMQTYVETKQLEMKKNPNSPVLGCPTIFDEDFSLENLKFELPKIPSLPSIGSSISQILEKMKEEIMKQACEVVSTDNVLDKLNNRYNYRAQLRAMGIKNEKGPLMDQMIDFQLKKQGVCDKGLGCDPIKEKGDKYGDSAIDKIEDGLDKYFIPDASKKK